MWPWAISVLSASILLSWLYNHTNGSILTPMLVHAANNTVTGGYFGRMFTGADDLRLWWLQAAVWAGAALIVVILAGRKLVRKSAAKAELAPTWQPAISK